MNNFSAFAELALPVPLPKTFSYGIPNALARAVPGMRARVRFGARVLVGCITAVAHEMPDLPEGTKLQPLLGLLDDEPVLTGDQLELAQWMAVGVGALLVAFIVVLARSDTDSNGLTSPLLGRAAPAIAGTTITGDTFDLADHRGSWVVVNFFQTDCIPCIEEHPELVAFDERRDDAQLVSIVFSDTEANARSFFAERGGDWPVIATDAGPFTIRYGVAAAPETFVIDPFGVVQAKFIGAITADALGQEIARLGGTA